MAKLPLLFTLYAFSLFYTGSLIADVTCVQNETCHGYSEPMTCTNQASCAGYNSTMNCNDNASCVGYWSDMTCNGSSWCYNYGSRLPSGSSQSRQVERIDKPDNQAVTQFMKQVTEPAVNQVYECYESEGNLYGLPGGQCIYLEVDAPVVEQALNTLLDDKVYSCSNVNNAYTHCQIIDEKGHVTLYRILMATPTYPSSNNLIRSSFLNSRMSDLRSIKGCTDGAFSDGTDYPGYYCTFNSQSPSRVQSALDLFIGFRSYTCSKKDNETLCTINNKVSLEMLYYRLS